MQQLTTCSNCGQQVYIDTTSLVAQACPACNSILLAANSPQQPNAHSHDIPSSPNPYVESTSAFAELTPLAETSQVPPDKSYEPMDTVMQINESANKKLFLGLLVGVLALTVVLVVGIYFLLSKNKLSEPTGDVAKNEQANHSERENQNDDVVSTQLEFDTLPSLSQQVSASREMRYEWHPTKRKSYTYEFTMSAGLEEVKITGTNKLNLSPAPA